MTVSFLTQFEPAEPRYRPLSPQQQALLPLLMGGWLTTGDALQKAGVWALSQRCGELSRMGYPIIKRPTKLPSGKTVTAYRIEQ